MGDSFFVKPGQSRKRTRPGSRPRPARPANARARADNDEDITSDSDQDGSEAEAGVEPAASDSESDHESEIDKRRRLAKEYLDSLETDLVEGFDAKDLDNDIIGRRLRHDVAEQQGQIFRDLAGARVSAPRKLRTKDRHLTAVAAASVSPAPASSNTTPGPVEATAAHIYTGAKDGILTKYSLAAGDAKPRFVRRRHVGAAVLSLAVNTANKMVVTGTANGFRVWNAESFEMLREFKLRTSVLSLAFRRRTNELYVGAADLRLRTYDLSQFAFVETLHGHQDQILGLSALNQERCVSVGGRDRTAIFWKIPEESRLTFRGGDTKLAARVTAIKEGRDAARPETGDHPTPPLDIHKVSLEGSIDCCAMLDHTLFVTGSDNGNAALWSTGRKKPQHFVALAHGEDPEFTRAQASADLNPDTRVEIPPAQPRSVTAIAAVPFSNAFFTGSWSGQVHMWTLAEDKRSFTKTKTVEVGSGIVTGLATVELGSQFVVTATLAREPRLGRWLVRPGHDRLVTFSVAAEQ